MTSAGVILGGTFAVFALVGGGGSQGSQLRAIGFGLAAGILMDTFLVRSLLVPSTVVLLGRWNWWPSSLSQDDEIGYREEPSRRAPRHPPPRRRNRPRTDRACGRRPERDRSRHARVRRARVRRRVDRRARYGADRRDTRGMPGGRRGSARGGRRAEVGHDRSRTRRVPSRACSGCARGWACSRTCARCGRCPRSTTQARCAAR